VNQIFGDAAHSSSGTVVRSIDTTFNAAGEIIEISDPDATIEYTREQLGRATTITNTIAGLTPTVVFHQTFDYALVWPQRSAAQPISPTPTSMIPCSD
jgi:YD repeat-containing protein